MINTYSKGQLVFSEGEASTFVGYIHEGEAEVIKCHGDDIVTIGQLKAGEYFGEMAAIEGRNHSASVRATSALIVEFV
ncbi:MAG: cyclic nucleotide-binding domain-containing protein [Alphaproteobacteria bacterium]